MVHSGCSSGDFAFIKGIEIYALLYFIYLVMAFLAELEASARGVPIGD